MKSDYQALVLEQADEVLTIRMNRPDRLNALNPQLVSELREVFQSLYFDRSVRVVILEGAGRAFCAGLDLGEHSEKPLIDAVLEDGDARVRRAAIRVWRQRRESRVIRMSPPVPRHRRRRAGCAAASSR